MKKAKLITLLIAPLLLTSCDADLTVIKKPNFASLGQEVSYEDFQNEVEKSLNKTDIFSEGLLKSKELTIKTANAQSRIYSSFENASSRSEKILSKKVAAEATESTIKYDANKLMALNKTTTNSLAIEKDSSVDCKEVEDSKSEKGLAVVNIDNGKSAISFNNMTMTYNVSKAFGEGDDPASYVDMQVKMACRMNIYYLFNAYLPADDVSEEEMGYYHFYKNANIFTYTYNCEESTDVKQSETLVARSYANFETKVQIELKENQQSLKYYLSSRYRTSYLNEYDGYHPGDVLEEKNESSNTASLKTKSVSLKKLNISKYDVVE